MLTVKWTGKDEKKVDWKEEDEQDWNVKIQLMTQSYSIRMILRVFFFFSILLMNQNIEE